MSRHLDKTPMLFLITALSWPVSHFAVQVPFCVSFQFTCISYLPWVATKRQCGYVRCLNLCNMCFLCIWFSFWGLTRKSFLVQYVFSYVFVHSSQYCLFDLLSVCCHLFQVDRLLDMIVNSLYSNREVFLRELVSNCSDALDKARFVSLTRPEILEGNEKLEIRIKADNENHTITVEWVYYLLSSLISLSHDDNEPLFGCDTSSPL